MPKCPITNDQLPKQHFDLAVCQEKADAYWGREKHVRWIVLDRKLLTGYVYPSFYL